MRIAAVQSAPVFLDLEGSISQACDLIREAGRGGAEVVGFPEGFIPGHPLWYHFVPASSAAALDFARRLSANSIEVPGPEVASLAAAARDAGVFVVMGVCERARRRPGTLFNALLFIDSQGRLVGHHRKLVPTVGERLVHTPGDADGLRVFEATGGAMVSGLVCGENSNPLATFALDAQGTSVHVAAWPSFFHIGVDMREVIEMVGRSLAYQMKAFVINAAGTVDDDLIEALPMDDREREHVRANSGGSSIIGPTGKILAGPLGVEEAILHADVDLLDRVGPKLVHDFGGHYNRFDLLRLHVVRSRYPTLTSSQGPERTP